jgi:excisionase family DNA binding protein
MPSRQKLAYSIPEAAEQGSVGVTTIYKEINAGSIKTLLVGDRRLIEHDELVRWLRSKRAPSPREAA